MFLTSALANIGDCLLSLMAPLHNAQSLGYLLFELMEPGTRMSDPRTLELRSSSPWGEQIRDFLAQTSQTSLEALQTVSAPVFPWFLKLTVLAAHIFGFLPGPKVPYTLCSSRKARKVKTLPRWCGKRNLVAYQRERMFMHATGHKLLVL